MATIRVTLENMPALTFIIAFEHYQPPNTGSFDEGLYEATVEPLTTNQHFLVNGLQRIERGRKVNIDGEFELAPYSTDSSTGKTVWINSLTYSSNKFIQEIGETIDRHLAAQ